METDGEIYHFRALRARNIRVNRIEFAGIHFKGKGEGQNTNEDSDK